MSEWLSTHQQWLPWVEAIAIASFVGSLLFIPVAIARIPDDYFAQREPAPSAWRDRHPVLRFSIWLARNIVGGLLVLAGVALLLLPGQGILTIAIGLVVADFPGKRRIELWAVARPGVLRSLNWVRARRGRSPLRVAAHTAPDHRPES